MRTSEDQLEQLGIERTRRAIVDAEVVVIIIDGSMPLTNEDFDVLNAAQNTEHLVALNKCDLINFDHKFIASNPSFSSKSIIRISAKSGDGLEALRAAIIGSFHGNESLESNFVITNARHYDLLRCCAKSLTSTENLLCLAASEELILVGLYDGLRFLGEITGETTPDDVLSEIFSTFCIGK